MRNPYLKNLKKIEFVLTYACTGRCKHCSQGEDRDGAVIDRELAVEVVRKIAAEYDIETVMTFGGEPLLCVDAVRAIMSTATELGIPRRQVITNGYFSNSPDRISEVARILADAGVNDLLISADAFHQETIPVDVAVAFAKAAVGCGISTRLSPAWLVGREDDNPYNRKTREVLDRFSALPIPVGEGNIVFPAGNAKKYLAEFFHGEIPKNPYIEDPCDVKCISFDPSGEVLFGNVYKTDITEILEKYTPKAEN